MAKFVGASRIAILKSEARKGSPVGGRKGALKAISKGFRSPNDAYGK